MPDIDSFHWNLARAFIGVSFIFAIYGALCHAIIIYITVKSKALRSTCNILIAICAVGDICNQLGGVLTQLPFFVGAESEMDIDFCILIMLPPLMGIAIGCSCILCIGIDRMIAIMFAISYRNMKTLYYHLMLASIIIASCAYSGSLIISFHLPGNVFCDVTAPLADGQKWFFSTMTIINLLSCVVYFVVWIRLRAQQNSDYMQRIVKSLIIIVVVDVSGWMLTPIFMLTSQHSDLDMQMKFALMKFAPIFVNLTLSCKFLIYYTTRRAFRVSSGIFDDNIEEDNSYSNFKSYQFEFKMIVSQNNAKTKPLLILEQPASYEQKETKAKSIHVK